MNLAALKPSRRLVEIGLNAKGKYLSSEQTNPALDIRLRTLLSSWKSSRGFRTVRAHHYRKQIVPHASQTELNREFENPKQTSAGWFVITLQVLSVIDYVYLRIGPSAGL
jgi:hypothetical protein